MNIPVSANEEALYSRQIFVYGHKGQHDLGVSSILVIGLNGVGVEAARNIILSGVKSVTLYDPVSSTFSNLVDNFCLTQAAVEDGKMLADACVGALAALNPNVIVQVLQLPSDLFLSEEIISSHYTVVILASQCVKVQLAVSNACRSIGTSVVMCDTFGVCGRVFCDFGETFVVTDPNGTPSATDVIERLTLLPPTIPAASEGEGVEEAITEDCEQQHVQITTPSPLDVMKGDLLKLNGLQGPLCSKLNDRTLRVLSLLNSTITCTFQPIPNSAVTRMEAGRFDDCGGFVTQIKEAKMLHFSAYSDSIAAPGNLGGLSNDVAKNMVLHLLFR